MEKEEREVTTAKVTQDVWTAIAAEWENPSEARNNQYLQYYQPFIRVMEREVPRQPSMVALEPGCGSAALSAYITGRWGARCVCLDFVPEMVSLSRQKFISNGISGDFIVADMRRLPFKEGVFDIVFNQGTIEHFPQHERQVVLDEMARVSRQYVAIFVPNRMHPLRPIAKWLQKVIGKYRWGIELPYSQWELERRLRQAGITTTRKSGVNFFRLWYIFWPVRPLLYPLLQRLLGDTLVHLNTSRSFLNRYFGDEIFQLGVKSSLPAGAKK